MIVVTRFLWVVLGSRVDGHSDDFRSLVDTTFVVHNTGRLAERPRRTQHGASSVEPKRQLDALVLGYIRERAMQRLAVDDGDVASFRMQWDRSLELLGPVVFDQLFDINLSCLV